MHHVNKRLLNHDMVAEGLIRLTNWFGCHEIWDCCMAFIVGPIFEESYAIRSALIAERVLSIGQARKVAHAFCKRAMKTQGVVEENMYYMGYANQRNEEGIPACSCVADASSTAQAIVDTIQAHPESPGNGVYIKSLRSFVDYVLDRYTTKNGVIGVGILSHKINPWPEYWCANALFAPILIGFGEITGEGKYLDAAVAPLEYLSRFNYANDNSTWKTSPTELIAYASEGLLAGLLSDKMQSRLDQPPKGLTTASPDGAKKKSAPIDAPNRVRDTAHTAIPTEKQPRTLRALLKSRWNEFAEWLYQNQDVNGVWQDPKDYRAYQLALSWTILRASSGLGTNPRLERCAERQLAYLLTQEAKSFFGLFCRPFATANAHLSFAYAAEICMKQDSERFAKALSEAEMRIGDHLW
ncbi:MAG: hypothetical protein Q7J67_08450 [bacterium]|nr:hypothetical protein [bacterium]